MEITVPLPCIVTSNNNHFENMRYKITFFAKRCILQNTTHLITVQSAYSLVCKHCRSHSYRSLIYVLFCNWYYTQYQIISLVPGTATVNNFSLVKKCTQFHALKTKTCPVADRQTDRRTDNILWRGGSNEIEHKRVLVRVISPIPSVTYVCVSVTVRCIVEKRQIGSGCPLVWWVGWWGK